MLKWAPSKEHRFGYFLGGFQLDAAMMLESQFFFKPNNKTPSRLVDNVDLNPGSSTEAVYMGK